LIYVATLERGNKKRIYDGKIIMTTIDDNDLQEIANTHGTPLYIYNAADIRHQCQRLQQTLAEHFDLHYSIKANPSLAISHLIRQQGIQAEIASDGELHIALAAGYTPEQIIFAGPGKTEQELRLAVQTKLGCINVESINELRLLNELAHAENTVQTIGLRINPAIEQLQHGKIINAGGAQKFGIDEAQAGEAITLAQQLPHLNLQGLHYSLASQVQHHDDFLALCHIILHSAKRLAEKHQFHPSILNFGGGIGVPHQASDTEFDLFAFIHGFHAIAISLKQQGFFKHCRFALELGRFIVSAAGGYLARVVDTKISQGLAFAILDGGINHALLPITANQYRVRKVLNNSNNEQKTTEVMLGGPLCTSVDSWRNTVSLPELHMGDLVLLENAGAYGLSASMLGFLSRQTPAEILVENNKALLIRQRSDVTAVLDHQIKPVSFL
jgi:diaminopimelate decarboxylase